MITTPLDDQYDNQLILEHYKRSLTIAYRILATPQRPTMPANEFCSWLQQQSGLTQQEILAFKKMLVIANVLLQRPMNWGIKQSLTDALSRVLCMRTTEGLDEVIECLGRSLSSQPNQEA